MNAQSSSALSPPLTLPPVVRVLPSPATVPTPDPPRLWQPGFLVKRGLERNLADVAERHFSIETTRRVLDVGCGSMPYRSLFEGRCCDYVGCDPFPQSSAVTRCTTEQLRFEDASFDAVVTFQVLEHTRHPWRMMAECARVLKPGGLLVLSASFLLPHQDAPCDYFRFTQEGLMELANDADLAVEEFHAHCTAISTLVLLLNCQLQRMTRPLQRLPVTRPLGTLASFGMFVPLNLLGLVCETRPFRTPADEMNEGFANHLIVCRKG